jgi:hypothetical protein
MLWRWRIIMAQYRKQRYRVTNWSEYDRALVNRGNLTIWFDEASIRDSGRLRRRSGAASPGCTRRQPSRRA